MTEPATRVALLARPGNACERLQLALREAGADVVLVADPTGTDAEGVRAAAVQVILVALEPSLEEALERFDGLLDDPAITVIFDEADLAAQREGWDAARWVRHLAAKLRRGNDVLPPGTEVESATHSAPTPGAGTLNLHQYHDQDHSGLGEFDLDAVVRAPRGGSSVRGADASLIDTEAVDTAALDIGDLAREFEALAATMPGRHPLDEPALYPPISEIRVQGPAKVQEASSQSVAMSDDPVATRRFHRDLAELNSRIATMELVDGPRPDVKRTGAVLVLAGIGGPDAVRQLLGGLPSAFPRPVLIQQRLDGARHDKLVRQMQRASSMPVHLADPGGAPEGGNVYILPEALGVVTKDNALRFQEGGDVFACLPADDSAVIVLSGSDPAHADAAMGLSWAGALVAGQMPEGCYDATAAEAVIARGAECGAPATLARRLAERWPA